MNSWILSLFLVAGTVITQDTSYIDLLSPYKEDRHVSNNRIGYGRTHIIFQSSLYATQRQFQDLKKLVEGQIQILARLVAGQKKLIKDKSRHSKWYKHTRKYLKKIYKSCTCEARETSTNYYVRSEPNQGISDVSLKGDNYGRTLSPVNNNDSELMLNDRERKRVVLDSTGGGEDRNFPLKHKNKAQESDLDRSPGVDNLDHEIQSHSKDVHLASEMEASKTLTTVNSNTTTAIPNISRTPTASPIGKSYNETHKSGEGFFDVVANLETGTINGNHSDITWLVYPSAESSPPCGHQGLVRLNFHDPSTNHIHKKIMIDMWFDTPQDWVFNVGDSELNDGGSGDGTAQENDCEVQGYGKSFFVYASDKSTNPYQKALYHNEDFLRTRLTLIVSNESIVWNNHDGNFNFLTSPALFALDNQSDSQGPVNFDIYLSLNRMIAGSYRSGRGLCKIALKWLD